MTNKNRGSAAQKSASENKKETTTATTLKKVTDEKVEKKEQPKEDKGKTPESDASIAMRRKEGLAKMQKLADRHDHLKMKDEELDDFMATNDGTKVELVLSNGAGHRVTVTNSDVINKTIGNVRTQLDELLKECEKEIAEFEL